MISHSDMNNITYINHQINWSSSSKHVGVLTRRSGPNQWWCCVFLVPDVDARGNTVTHGFILVPAVGPYVQQRVCESTVPSCTGGACSRGYKQGDRGREAPKSLLEEELIEANANIGTQKSVCALWVVLGVVLDELIPKGKLASSFYRHKEGQCTCTGNRRSRRLLLESWGCSGRAL